MRRPFIAGNWKMNGTRASVDHLLDGLLRGVPDGAVDVAVCVPYVFLEQTQKVLTGSAIAWGAQNLSIHASGAYTGEISAAMLMDFGCKYVIVGHSERRTYYGEDDALVARKYQVALDAGLTPILCIGETLQERESGITEEVVARQLNKVVEVAGIAAIGQGVVAYEPVWAIGTGKTATPAQAQDVHAFIRAQLASHSQDVAAGVKIQYGGSMKADNASELLANPDIDGGLIGGASLVAKDFLGIIAAARP